MFSENINVPLRDNREKSVRMFQSLNFPLTELIGDELVNGR